MDYFFISQRIRKTEEFLGLEGGQYFSLPYCIRYFEFLKSNLVQRPQNLLYTNFKQNLSFPRTFDRHSKV